MRKGQTHILQGGQILAEGGWLHSDGPQNQMGFNYYSKACQKAGKVMEVPHCGLVTNLRG